MNERIEIVNKGDIKEETFYPLTGLDIDRAKDFRFNFVFHLLERQCGCKTLDGTSFSEVYLCEVHRP